MRLLWPTPKSPAVYYYNTIKAGLEMRSWEGKSPVMSIHTNVLSIWEECAHLGTREGKEWLSSAQGGESRTVILLQRRNEVASWICKWSSNRNKRLTRGPRYRRVRVMLAWGPLGHWDLCPTIPRTEKEHSKPPVIYTRCSTAHTQWHSNTIIPFSLISDLLRHPPARMSPAWPCSQIIPQVPSRTQAVSSILYET